MIGQHSLMLLNHGRQWAAVATAFSLPISTTGTAISVSLLVIVTLLTTPRDEWHCVLRSPATLLPAVLLALITLSMLWSSQPFGPGGFTHYTKLLLIPVVMVSTFSPRQSMQIAHAFAAACIVILALSLASLFWQSGPWGWFKGPGVPVKDNAVQSTCFALCSFGLGLYTIHFVRAGSWLPGVVTSLLAVLLFVDVFLINLSKTGALITVVLAAFFLARMLRWRARLGIAILLILIAALAISLSSEAQRRVAEISADIRVLEGSSATAKEAGSIGSPPSKATVSTASRIDFWQKSIEFIQQAPLLGHGAGSTKSLYASLEIERPSPYGEAVPDPHNQFLAIAIQVGLVGGALLIMMWIAHFSLVFGASVPHLLGQAVILQNVLGSLFNSSLSQVTQGTLYCLAIGMLGALIRQQRKNPATREGSEFALGSRELPKSGAQREKT